MVVTKITTKHKQTIKTNERVFQSHVLFTAWGENRYPIPFIIIDFIHAKVNTVYVWSNFDHWANSSMYVIVT